jgi:hypothetical protein
MKISAIGLAAFGALAALSGDALADHNSKWGEGWANMPNDIHNTRVETRGDDEAFRDFVKQGAGADSVNRFDTDEANGRVETRQRGNAEQKAAARGKDADKGATKDKSQRTARKRDKAAVGSHGRMQALGQNSGRTAGARRGAGRRGH